MPEFMPGLDLCGRFYREAVRPILQATFPALPYSAALIGPGSEVLGFDTPMSTDHHWGPRLMLFLRPEDRARHRDALHETLRQRLPVRFEGHSTHFSPPDPADSGTQLLEAIESGPVNHRVEIYTVDGFVQQFLGFDIHAAPAPADWLTFPQQKLRALTAGAVYHDGVGLDAMRAQFAWYPRDVWLYLLAAGWMRLSQEEHLMGRAGTVGDEIGSALIGGRLVRDVMQLCFLMERQYTPYAKWFGTAFRQLDCAARLEPLLAAVLRAQTWQEREHSLVAAYETLAEMHNALGITGPLPEKAARFHGRPFMVIHSGQFVNALLDRVTDPAVQRIAARTLIGNIDQFSDSTDLREDRRLRDAVRGLYE